MDGFPHFSELCCFSQAYDGNCVVTAEGTVVKIQIFGVSCKGILTSEVFLICNEYLAEILAVFLAHKAVIQDGGFASSWNDVEIV